ncbi:hypothetical protein [Ralstonia chuxiongensis]|uniref:hypothetical protein n=1 Tax=Ralstonia chuxiongensis TaxID=2957504 RepID=UPI0028F5FC0E|nr:hypothetical protein [Ralstonia chuxiongensis]CAJ0773061.1 hypothetical protein R8510_03250 [Ralstonia chuxiongensis]
MDRTIIYSGQVPQTTDLLTTNKQTMIALAKLCADLFGTATVATGLACVPTSPASMSVNINPGQIYQLANVDGTAYSAINADTTHSIVKQGILMDAQNFAITAPGTVGYSQNYLIQATYLDSDTNNTVLPYYNSANPTQAFNGPGGNGTLQPTTRAGQVSLQLVAGTAAATGSQTTPAVTAGYVGLWVITVANGQSTITSGNIAAYAGQPILPSSVLAAVQTGNLSYAVATGTANAHTIALTPALTARVDGMVIRYKAPAANNSAVTLNDGVGTANVVGGNHSALQGGEYAANGDAFVVWNSSIGGGSYILLDCTGGAMQTAPATKSQHAVQMGQIQTQAGTAFTTGGTAPAFTLTPSPAITSYVAGQRFRVNFNAVGTTGANTLNINGLGAVGLAQYGPDGAINPAVIPGNLLTDVEYNGSLMIVLDPVSSGYVGLLPVSASVASNALTCTLSPTALAFRSGTLSSGAITPLSTGTLSITVPSGATLGTVGGTQAMLALLVAYNGGTPVLCIANVAGGLDLSETNLISPTTISGSSNSASTIYSASAVSANSPYRVVGYVNITELTAGAWSSGPSLVQGQGGEAFAAMQSFGFGQTEQDVTASRLIGVTYYNTTSRPILVNVGLTSTATNQSAVINVNGVAFAGSSFPNAGFSIVVTAIVRSGASYQVPTGSYTLSAWKEIR